MYQTAFVPYDAINVAYTESNRKMDMKVQHYHDAYEIFFQVSGERYLFLDEICHTLKQGDLYLLKPFALHYTESRDASYYSRYVVNFREEDLNGLLTPTEKELLLQKLESGIYHLQPEQHTQMQKLFELFLNTSRRTGFLAEKSLHSCLLCLLLSLTDILRDGKVTRELSAPSNIQPEIMEAIRYLNHHFGEQIDLDSVASQVHMSKYHFCRLFHQATGATFLQYLYNIRLARVHQLLTQTGLPLSEIARRCGFSSTAHLSRIFHSAYHTSPREFRREAQKE